MASTGRELRADQIQETFLHRTGEPNIEQHLPLGKPAATICVACQVQPHSQAAMCSEMGFQLIVMTSSAFFFAKLSKFSKFVQRKLSIMVPDAGLLAKPKKWIGSQTHAKASSKQTQKAL